MSTGKAVGRPRPPEEPTKVSPGRRKFLSGMAGAAGGGCLMAVGVGLYAQQARALPPLALRPPGALSEPEFLASCTRCGLCVRDCPYKILKLATPGDSVPTGTPYFTARTDPCPMCEDIPCIKNCPTGALDPNLKNINDARMGLAVLSDQETCIAYLGLRCEVCYRVCPVIDKAITLEKRHNPRSDKHSLILPIVHSDYCTGCGMCEKACILPEAAIRVLPPKIVRGELGEHYRKSWEEREKHGGSLIGDQLVEPKVYGLEHKAYGDTRVNDDDDAKRPAPDDLLPPPALEPERTP